MLVPNSAQVPNIEFDARAVDLETQTSSLVAVDMLFILLCSFGVFLITPAIGLFYGGTLKRKNIVQVLIQTYMVTSCIIIIWYLIGYSLANSPTLTSVMIGNVDQAALHEEEAKPLFEGGSIPSIINFCFNSFFPVAPCKFSWGESAKEAGFSPRSWLDVCG